MNIDPDAVAMLQNFQDEIEPRLKIPVAQATRSESGIASDPNS
jgi:hypothetical protein